MCDPFDDDFGQVPRLQKTCAHFGVIRLDHRSLGFDARTSARVDELADRLDGARALSLIGRGWLLASVNAGAKCCWHLLNRESV